MRELNQIPPRMMIKAGSALIVPRTEAHDQDVSLHIADTASLSFTPEYSLASATVRVQRGDTLLGLAQRHKVSVAQLASWNKLTARSTLRIGQVLHLQHGGGSHTSAPAKKGVTRVAQKSSSKNARKAAPKKRGGTPVKKKR